MYEVAWKLTVKGGWWHSTHDTWDEAIAKVNTLRTAGFYFRRKSGVTVFYPPNRIFEIKVVPNKRKIAAMQELKARQTAMSAN